MSPLVAAMLEAVRPAYDALADRIRIGHLDFPTPEGPG